MVWFIANCAKKFGGCISATRFSSITFEGKAIVIFTNNHAVTYWGGTIYFEMNCTAVIGGKSIAKIYNNKVICGGAITCDRATIMVYETSTMKYI